MAAIPEPRHVEQLERDGFCVVEGALTAQETSALRARLAAQAAAERDAGEAFEDGGPEQQWGQFRDADGRIRREAFTAVNGGVNQRLWMLVNKGPEFLALLRNRPTRALADHLLGDEYLLSSFTANIARPGGVAMPLHTDQWWMPAPTRRGRRPLPVGSMTRFRFDRDESADEPAMVSPPVVLNVLFMLDAFTEANGATRVVPGSHLSGRQPDPERDAGVESIAAEGPAGAALVLDGRTWHGTGENRSNQDRNAAIITYCGPQLRPQENFTIGTSDGVLRDASDDLRALLGFKVWWGYGRTGHPTVDFVDRDQFPSPRRD